MEEKKTLHSLKLSERTKLTATEICDVDTFDESRIVLFTEDETLNIEGENLHIQKFDVKEGELVIEGQIYSISYSETNFSKRNKGFFKKLLK